MKQFNVGIIDYSFTYGLKLLIENDLISNIFISDNTEQRKILFVVIW